MTTPAGPFLGLISLNDGVHTTFKWNDEDGLGNPASVPSGAVIDTFAGPYRIPPTPMAMAPKEIAIVGYFNNTGGVSEGYDRFRRAMVLSALTAGTVTRYQVGSLFLRIIPHSPTIPEFRAHSTTVPFGISGTAIPGTFERLYSYRAEGRLVQSGSTATYQSGLGVCISNDVPGAFGYATGTTRTRPTAPTVTNGIFAVNNLGDVATPLVCTIEFSAGRTTVFYLRVVAPGYSGRRVSAIPAFDGVAVVTEKDGLFIPPGRSEIRIEESTGAAVTGTIFVSTYGTKFRFQGIASAYGTDMGQEWPVFYNSRPGRAYFNILTQGATAYVGFEEANQGRFGAPNQGGTVATIGGHVVEGTSTNLLLHSQDQSNAVWMKTGMGAETYLNTAPDNTATAYESTATLADSYISQSFTGSAVTHTFSVWLRATAGTNTINIYLGDSLGSSNTSCAITTTWQRFSVTRSVNGIGLYVQVGGGSTWATGETVEIWGCQVESTFLGTSYIPTTSATRTREADVLAMVQPLHNLVRWSNRFDKTTAVRGTVGLWYTTGTMSASRVASPQVTGDAYQWTGTAGANSYFEQAIANAAWLAEQTVTFSIWIKSTAAAGAGYGVTLSILDGGTTRVSVSKTVYDTWSRFAISYRLNNTTADRDLRVQVLEPNGGSRVFQIFGAQVTVSNMPLVSGGSLGLSHANPYADTTSTEILPENGMAFPWFLTQNGYLEFDALFHYVPGGGNSPNFVGWTLIETGFNSTEWISSKAGLTVGRSSLNAAATHTISASMYTCNEADNTIGGTVLTATATPSATVFDGTFATYRVEWQNYLLNGTRTMRFRIIITQGATVTTGAWFSASAGMDKFAWGSNFDPNGFNPTIRPDLFFLVSPESATGVAMTIRNVKMDALAIPAGAVPEPY